MRIVLGDRIFNGDLPDSDGSYWYIEDWGGWDAPGLRQATEGPTGVHGAVLTESLLDSRVVTLKGICKAPNEEVFWSCYNNLLGLTNNLVKPRALVVHEFVPKSIDVIRGGPPRIELVGVGAFRFELELLALNPLKKTVASVSTSISPGSTVSILNGGTFDSEPVVRATTNGTIDLVHNGTGARVSTEGTSVASGTVLDYPSRTVTSPSGGNLFTAVTRQSVWWSLKPGANSIKNNGSARVTLVHHDTWL